MNAPGGKIVTFYSYKGGTGRSMLLANLAWLLASNGKRVLAIDWDLEAPGLHRYFRPFLVDSDLTETDGLIDAFWELTTHVMAEGPRPADNEKLLSERFDLEDFVTPVEWNFANGGGIDLVGAGRQGASYSERVNTFDWKRFYQMGGGSLLDGAKETLTRRYDFVFIDSRTGVSDTSGICTIQLPDLLVACFTLNRQSIEGVGAVLASVVAARSGSPQPSSPSARTRNRIATFPVATRIENSEKEKLDAARQRARAVLSPFVPQGADGSRGYWDDMEVTYRPFYAYEEVLAAFADPSGAAGSAKTLLSETDGIGRKVFGMQQLATTEIPESDRQRVLGKYAFSATTDTKARVKADEKPQTPGEEADFHRTIYAKEVRWRNNGYRYGDLLSRRELQLITPDERAKFGRNMTFYCANSELVPGFCEKIFLNFVLIWTGFLILGLMVAFLPRVMFYFWGSDGVGTNSLSTLTLFATSFAATVAYRVLSLYRSEVKPYGVSFEAIFFLSLAGPLRHEIRDYQPEPGRN